MKTALLVLAALVGASWAQTCDTPVYEETLEPQCSNGRRVQLPNYLDATTFYSCASGSPVLQKCPAATPYFTYVYQGCTTCAQYIPAVECSGLTINVECYPIDTPAPEPTAAPTATPTGAPTAAPTTAPTAAPTDAPTAVPTDAPTAAPTDAPTTASNVPTPNGPVTSVPEPPTPVPTAPVLPTGPPSIP